MRGTVLAVAAVGVLFTVGFCAVKPAFHTPAATSAASALLEEARSPRRPVAAAPTPAPAPAPAAAPATRPATRPATGPTTRRSR